MKKLQKVMDAINRYYISELLYFDETVPIVFIQQKEKRWIEGCGFIYLWLGFQFFLRRDCCTACWSTRCLLFASICSKIAYSLTIWIIGSI
jgi:hypothetical protein